MNYYTVFQREINANTGEISVKEILNGTEKDMSDIMLLLKIRAVINKDTMYVLCSEIFKDTVNELLMQREVDNTSNFYAVIN